MRFLFFCLPLLAQIEHLEMTFEGVNCVPCVESMPGRAMRIRGVTSARVDAAKGLLVLELAEGNRVRVEQIRDLIQQDGTKAVRVPRIVVGGVVEKGSDSEWMLRLPQQALPLELKTSKALTAGATIKVEGAIEDLKKSPLVLVEG